MGAIGGIDIDEDESRQRGAELRQHPFAVVGRPDADPVARLEAERPQADREVFGTAQEIGVGPAHVLMARHQREPLRAFFFVRRSSAPIVSPSSGVELAPWT